MKWLLHLIICSLHLGIKGGSQRNETVIFVPATPGGELKKRYQRVKKEAGMRITVAEVPGASLKKRLQRSDPFNERRCREKETCVKMEREESAGMRV